MTKSTIDKAVLDALEVGMQVIDADIDKSSPLLEGQRRSSERAKKMTKPSILRERSVAQSMDRDAAPLETEETLNTAQSQRVAEGVTRVLEEVFGAKAFADVVDDHGAPNLLAIRRVERAVKTSSDLSDSQREFLLDGVHDLENAYRERLAAEYAHHQQELADARQRAIHDRIQVPLAAAVFCVDGQRKDAARQLQEHCEGVAKRGNNDAEIAQAATVFRNTWQEIWGSGAANTSMGAQEALEVLGSSVSDTEDAVIIDALPRLRLLSGLYDEPVSPMLLARGRAALQVVTDEVLRRKLRENRATRH